jgi:hypothetical protein
MPIRSISFFTYRTRGSDWSAPQLGVLRFIRALKQRDLGGCGDVLVNGREPKRRLMQQNATVAFDWFAEMAVPLLREELGTLRVALVPIPNCDCTTAVLASGTSALADAVRTRAAAVIVSDVLRWRQKMPSARSGQGPRDPALLYPNLRLRPGWTPHPRPHVLVDDVVAGGGHLRACAAFLHAHGANVQLAIAAAKADWDPPDDPFQRRVEEYPDFEPERGT